MVDDDGLSACRRGYDVIDFAKAGASASIGLEIAPTAVRHDITFLPLCGYLFTCPVGCQGTLHAMLLICTPAGRQGN